MAGLEAAGEKERNVFVSHYRYHSQTGQPFLIHSHWLNIKLTVGTLEQMLPSYIIIRSNGWANIIFAHFWADCTLSSSLKCKDWQDVRPDNRDKYWGFYLKSCLKFSCFIADFLKAFSKQKNWLKWGNFLLDVLKEHLRTSRILMIILWGLLLHKYTNMISLMMVRK